MHIPSSDVYKELFNEEAGVWFVRSIGTDTHAILLKARLNVLKAIMIGCKVKASFAVYQSENTSILISCISIYDDKDAPILILNPHLSKIEHIALVEILHRESTPLFLYDELGRNIAWGESSWSQSLDNVIKLISLSESLYDGKFIRDVKYALDNLQISLDPTIVIPSAYPIKFEQVDLLSHNYKSMDIWGVSVNDKGQLFNSLSKDEGGGFEQTVWQLLEDLFAYQLYKSPQTISNREKKRELTDIFGVTDMGLFLFESKTVLVLNTSPERGTERRARNLEGQIKTALSQLVGGIRSIKNGYKIVSQSDIDIDVNRKLCPHGIVVISETLPKINWGDVFQCLMKSSVESRSMLHIFDLNELRIFVDNSPNVNHFDYYLMKRFEQSVREKNPFKRIRFIRK
jgi:hypothetical protein